MYISRTQGRWLTGFVMSLITILLISCGGSTTNTPPTPNPTLVRVNGFGSAANHVHSLLTLPNHVLVLATHYGTFRSEDDGATWKEVAGGDNQLMGGLMTYSLSYSPLNLQRLYMLTRVATIPHSGTLGLYTSDDQGRTWKLAIPQASLTSSSIFLVAAGNDTPDEVYIYLSDLGALGLRISLDDGQHFSATGMLPFGLILGLLVIPGKSGHLLAYGSDGMARSVDGGAHWQVIKGISGGISDMATAGPNSPIYASGDEGIFVSHDGGATFTLVAAQASFASLTISPSQPQVVYGKTGLAVYRSTDGGHTWSALPHISGNLGVLAVDSSNASVVYLALNYPTAVYRFDASSKAWLSLTPQA